MTTVVAKHRQGKQTAGQQSQRTAATSDKLLSEIKNQQTALDRHEGDALVAVVQIGKLLCELRPLAKKDWAKQLTTIPMHPRIASRYMAIVKGSIGAIGPAGSDLLARLPYDLQRFEQLSKLSLDQLEQLAQEMDLRRATREEVGAAVKELLGKSTARPPALTRIQKRFTGLQKLILGHLKDSSTEDQVQCRAVVANCLEMIQDAMQNGDPTDVLATS
jgi:hypothetical protein